MFYWLLFKFNWLFEELDLIHFSYYLIIDHKLIPFVIIPEKKNLILKLTYSFEKQIHSYYFLLFCIF